MPKKKKKNGGEGKRKPKKEKKPPEPTITLREAMLALQLKVKERAVEEFTDEAEALKFKNDRQRDRNRKLKEEREDHLQRLLIQARAMHEEESKKRRVETCEVEEAMLAKFGAERKAQQEVEEMEGQLAHLEDEIKKVQAEVASWHDYKDRIRHQNSARIRDMKMKIDAEIFDTEVLAKDLEKRFSFAQRLISDKVDQTVLIQEELWAKYAHSHMPSQVKEEMKSKPKLKKELVEFKSYRRQLGAEVDAMERVNIDLAREGYDLQYDPVAQKKQASGRMIEYRPMSSKQQQQGTLPELRTEAPAVKSRYPPLRVLSPPRVRGAGAAAMLTSQPSALADKSLPAIPGSSGSGVLAKHSRQRSRPNVTDLAACMEGRESLPLITGSYSEQQREFSGLQRAFIQDQPFALKLRPPAVHKRTRTN